MHKPRYIAPACDLIPSQFREVPAPGARAAAPSPPRLKYHGGRVLAAVEAVPVFWGGAWAGQELAPLVSGLNGFFDFILTSPLMDLLAEYSTAEQAIGHGRRLAHVAAPGEPGTLAADGRRVTDGEIQQSLEVWTRDSTLPAVTANTLYFLYLPPGVVSIGPDGAESCKDFCGYHGHADGRIFYAVIPYTECRGCTMPGGIMDTLTSISSHELCDAVTNPALDAWWDPASGEENSDICNRRTQRLGPYLVQATWSNSQGACAVGPAATS